MREASFKAGGLTLYFELDMDAFVEIEENVCMIGKLLEELSVKSKNRVRTLCAVAAILTGGAERAEQDVAKKAGREMDECFRAVPVEELKRKIKPAMFNNLYSAVIVAVNNGFSMETSEPDPEAEVDVTLQEIEKKEQRGG